MRTITRIRRSVITIFFIVLCVLLLTKCINEQSSKTKDDNREYYSRFAGSDACAGCHKDIYEDHISTAHYLTSRPASEKYIRGSFEAGKNTFAYNGSVYVAMEKRDSSFYQVEYVNGVDIKHHRFDIVVGSGAKGQTYLYWMKNKLLQLPVTYFTAAGQWSNSPGYPGRVVFNRPITSRCLECHSTYVQKISDATTEPEDFDHNKVIYGVDCEKCHGPAGMHVEFHQQNPKDTTAKFIMNPASFSRQQQLDMCALCHGGRLSKTRPSFSFQAGDKLSDYFVFDTAGRNPADIDVHGNQFGLLAASKCFTMSKTMTCNTCHDPHANERGDLVLFSQRCMSCHNTEHGTFCKVANMPGAVINKNCIDCHMPRQSSRAIAVLLEGATTPTAAMMRSHYIKVYPEETDRVRELIRQSKGPGEKESRQQNRGEKK